MGNVDTKTVMIMVGISAGVCLVSILLSELVIKPAFTKSKSKKLEEPAKV